MRICKLCRKDFRDYQSKKRTRCGPCNIRVRRYRIKAAAVKYLGGKCRGCGWGKNQAALQFHSISPGKKEFVVGEVANGKWECLKRELKKYILLCANCHIIKHRVEADPKLAREAKTYKGQKLNF